MTPRVLAGPAFFDWAIAQPEFELQPANDTAVVTPALAAYMGPPAEAGAVMARVEPVPAHSAAWAVQRPLNW